MTFVPAARSEDLQEGATLPVEVGGKEILLCRYDGKVFAVDNLCSHMIQKMTGARLRRGQIICPVHGARFNLETGAPAGMPATAPIGVHEVREIDGSIELLAAR